MATPKLTHKIQIDGIIECKTGLRIGGNKSSLEIGGLDLNIIKSVAGVPYIPGSSIKGKLRSLLGKVRGAENADQDDEPVKNLFGGGGGKEAVRDKEKGYTTRLFVRDADLDTNAFKSLLQEKPDMDFAYSEVKTENVISRTTGKAEHPRSIERVPAGARFKLNVMLDVYDGDSLENNLGLLAEAIELLHLDYLGGHGSRGSGQVEVTITAIKGKAISAGLISEMNDPALEQFKNKFGQEPAIK